MIDDRAILPLWLATGLYLNQFFHTAAYSSSDIMWGLFGFEFPLYYSWVAAGIIYLAGDIVDGVITPGYSYVANVFSELLE